MRPYALACLLALASFTLVAGACNFKLGDDTEGEMGNLRFAYSGPGCFFGCSLDKKAMQGAKVSVTVIGDTTGGLTGSIEDDGAARVIDPHDGVVLLPRRSRDRRARSIVRPSRPRRALLIAPRLVRHDPDPSRSRRGAAPPACVARPDIGHPLVRRRDRIARDEAEARVARSQRAARVAPEDDEPRAIRELTRDVERVASHAKLLNHGRHGDAALAPSC